MSEIAKLSQALRRQSEANVRALNRIAAYVAVGDDLANAVDDAEYQSARKAWEEAKAASYSATPDLDRPPDLTRVDPHIQRCGGLDCPCYEEGHKEGVSIGIEAGRAELASHMLGLANEIRSAVDDHFNPK